MNDFNVTREDNAYDNRVELHCHTNMSFKDGIATADEIVSQAFKFGHKAIAITDHGSVRAYPEIANAVKRIKKEGGDINIKGEDLCEYHNIYTAMILAKECLARGIKFLPTDIENSDPDNYIPENGNIRIPL